MADSSLCLEDVPAWRFSDHVPPTTKPLLRSVSESALYTLICDICIGFAPNVFLNAGVDEYNQPKTRAQLWRTWKKPKWEQSARRGCPTCRLVLRICDIFTSRDEVAEMSIEAEEEYGALLLQLRKLGSTRTIDLHISMAPGGTHPWSLIRTSSWLNSRPNVMYCADFIRDRLSSCATHSRCIKSVQRTYKPTRLLFIGYPERKVNPCLVRGSEVDEASKYIALSHCWGDIQPLQTVKSNLQDHFSSIPSSEIPRTFKDAMNLARALGIEYLWIDSLCIVQDDQSDWSQESGEMASVYGASFLTIAAGGAKDCTGGLFYERRPIVINYEERNPVCQIQVRHASQHTDSTTPSFRNGTEDSNTLRDRAWAFQERLLSPRTIHFTKQEMLWDCLMDRACECTMVKKYKASLDISMVTVGLPEGSYDARRLESMWEEIITAYASKKLTFERDRLPALSGIASLFAKANNGSRYLAGIWQCHPRSLLWWTPNRLEQGNRLGYPSFSWISMAGVAKEIFSKPLSHTSEIVKVLDAHCDLATSDKFGEVTGGYIKLHGHLVEATLSITDDEPSYSAQIDFTNTTHSWAHYGFGGVGLDYDTRTDGMSSGDTVFYLPIQGSIDDFGEQYSDPANLSYTTYGILLRAIHPDSDYDMDAVKNCGINHEGTYYRRIGTSQFMFKKQGDHWGFNAFATQDVVII